MKLVEIKKASECPLKGVKMEIEDIAGSPKSVTFTDSEGNLLKVCEYYSGVRLLKVAPPEFKKKWAVNGVLGLLTLTEELFDHKHEADQRRQDILDVAHPDAVCDIKVTEKEVLVEE